jgi:hypothetical protein
MLFKSLQEQTIDLEVASFNFAKRRRWLRTRSHGRCAVPLSGNAWLPDFGKPLDLNASTGIHDARFHTNLFTPAWEGILMFGVTIPAWLVNLLSSAAVSLVVSVVVFSIGVRVGKERADRSLARKKYEEIYAHFKDLLGSIEARKLRYWSHYDLIGNVYSPHLRKGEHDGSNNIIPKALAKRFLETETEALVASTKVRKEIEDVHVPEVGVQFDRHREGNRKQSSSYSCRTLSICDFITMSRVTVEEILDSIDKDTYFAIDTSTERGKSHSLYVRDDMMYEGTMRDFILKLHSERQANRKVETSALDNAAKRLIDDLKTLSDRIRDPHPLRATVFGSIRDFFN